MQSEEILKKYIAFYTTRSHVEIPAVSLVPENDPTLLYVNSGMFPLVPYLLGEKHPAGTRLVNVQRCLRFFEDLENVGETNRHTTAFHMLGNWSLNDYFKREQLTWAYEFYIEVLGLDPAKMYATVFAGDADAPKDTQSIDILTEIFAKYGITATEGERIFPYGKKDNWWQRGEALGELGGPDSEIFYYVGTNGTGLGQNPADNQDDFLEIGNSVFIQYEKTAQGWQEIAQKNVDFGGGLERVALILQHKHDIFETDNFWPIIEELQKMAGKNYSENPRVRKAMRILADHMRSATFLAMDGVVPSNKDQGYILRRLLRLMVRAGKELGVENISSHLVPTVCNTFAWLYPNLPDKQREISQIFATEENTFNKVLARGEAKAAKLLDGFTKDVSELAQLGFDLYQSDGYPIEIFLADAKDKGLITDTNPIEELYKNLVKSHQSKSREGAEKKFTGGLADQSEQTVKYHTTTHLLHWALREVLGTHVQQMGSNITGERLRFDFSHTAQLNDEQIAQVENLINTKIDENLPVGYEVLSKTDAEKTGALHFFGEKYGDTVKVYYIGNSSDTAVSKEFCGGPHVARTGDLGHVKIFKQKKMGEKLVRVYVTARP